MASSSTVPLTPSEAFMEDLAKRVAERVIQDLRRTPIIAQRLLNVKDVATMLGRTEDAVRSLVTAGHLKNCSPDGRVQIDIRDIETWITNNKR
jgi:hypothetical protein